MVKRKHTPVYFTVLQQFTIKRCMDVWLFHIFQRKIWQFAFFVTFADKSAEITHIINVLIIHLKNIAMKVSLFKQKNKQRTIARTELQDVVKSVRDCVYSSAVCQLREVYMFSRRMDDGSIETDFRLDEKVPRACFAADMKV
jgi:hypothetical protein